MTHRFEYSVPKLSMIRPSTDEDDHGTHVSGIVATVAQNAQLLMGKIDSLGDENSLSFLGRFKSILQSCGVLSSTWSITVFS